MQTVISGRTFITKFFYDQIPDSYFKKTSKDSDVVIRGKQRKRFKKSRTTIVKVYEFAGGELVQIAEASVKSFQKDVYVKAVGRKLAFLKVLENPSLKPFETAFVDSFEEQCQRSNEYDVSNLLHRPSELVRG
jgi:hypothetical protein